jgi:hypothetical protein
MRIRKLAIALAGSALLVSASVGMATAGAPTSVKVAGRTVGKSFAVAWLNAPMPWPCNNPTFVHVQINVLGWDRVTYTAGSGAEPSGGIREAGMRVVVQPFTYVWEFSGGAWNCVQHYLPTLDGQTTAPPVMDDGLTAGSAGAYVPGYGQVQATCIGYGATSTTRSATFTVRTRQCSPSLTVNGSAVGGGTYYVHQLVSEQGTYVYFR